MLNRLNPVEYKPLCASLPFRAEAEGESIRVSSGEGRFIELKCLWVETTASLRVTRVEGLDDLEHPLAVAIEFLLGHLPAVKTLELVAKSAGAPTFLRFFETDPGRYFFERKEFFQLPLLWHRKGRFDIAPERWTETQQRRHPIRPWPARGVQYRRYVPSIGRTISFRVAQVESDLELFHGWHHQPRVAEFWEMAYPVEKLREYLSKGLVDPHQTPMIVEADGDPVGYFEMYWTAEDRLGPYYPYEPFDRGFHFLIGAPDFLGLPTTGAVVESACHFLFLDEPRTRRIMAEPRHDNARVLKYADAIAGWRKIKEFDFPHKRAALLECDRARFFQDGSL